ncbi:MAG: hypothetical protein RLZZ568_1603 [Cyanobacteriota bacterium]
MVTEPRKLGKVAVFALSYLIYSVTQPFPWGLLSATQILIFRVRKFIVVAWIVLVKQLITDYPLGSGSECYRRSALSPGGDQIERPINPAGQLT